MSREQWLLQARDALMPLYAEIDLKLPEVYVAAGWPSRGALPGKKQRIGECWPAGGANGVPHVFVTPMLDKAVPVLEVLVHELIHAAVGPGVGHKAGFGRPARALGLEGPLTSTRAGDALKTKLQEIAAALGDYPSSAIQLEGSDGPKKQGTRMLKLQAECCGYVVRTTQKWIDAGLPSCPCGNDLEPDRPA